MFDLKREFEEHQTEPMVDINTIDRLLSTVDTDLIKNRCDELTKEMATLTKIDFCLGALGHPEEISYETAISNLEEVLKDSGMDLEYLGLSKEGGLSFESGNDQSMWKKVWEWIKKKLEWIKNYLITVFEALTGKYAAPRMALSKISDELERVFKDVKTESALGEDVTHEGIFSKKPKMTNKAIQYSRFSHIPGAAVFVDIGKGLNALESMLDEHNNVANVVGKGLEILSKEAKNLTEGKNDNLVSSLIKHYISKGRSQSRIFKLIKDGIDSRDACILVHNFLPDNKSEISTLRIEKDGGDINSAFKIIKKKEVNIDNIYSGTKSVTLMDIEDAFKYIKSTEELINKSERTATQISQRLKSSLDSCTSLGNNIKYDNEGRRLVMDSIVLHNTLITLLANTFMDNVSVYKNFINVLNIHKKALIDWGDNR